MLLDDVVCTMNRAREHFEHRACRGSLSLSLVFLDDNQGHVFVSV